MTLDELRAHTVTDEHGTVRFAAPYGQMAVSLVEAEFLYALVRLTKPERVLELGTGYGVSARFIAEGLSDNGRGVLYTIEPSAEIREHAGTLLGDGALPVRVLDDFDAARSADLVFIDSGYEHREHDIAHWLTGTPGPLIVVHDANRDYPALRGRGVRLPGSDGFWIGRAG